MNICPICKKYISSIKDSSISRFDNKTVICNECGFEEAFITYLENHKNLYSIISKKK